jgi:hypothetical protein
MPFPEKLKLVQSLMKQGDARAQKIYQTIGVYLGYGIAHFASFYDLRHVLILGRVTSGEGGDMILSGAQEVLQVEFPELAAQIAFHIPGRKRQTARSGDCCCKFARYQVRQPPMNPYQKFVADAARLVREAKNFRSADFRPRPARRWPQMRRAFCFLPRIPTTKPSPADWRCACCARRR